MINMFKLKKKFPLGVVISLSKDLLPDQHLSSRFDFRTQRLIGRSSALGSLLFNSKILIKEFGLKL